MMSSRILPLKLLSALLLLFFCRCFHRLGGSGSETPNVIRICGEKHLTENEGGYRLYENKYFDSVQTRSAEKR